MSDVNDYVAGDVNTIDDGYEDDDQNGNEIVDESSDAVANAATATAVLHFIATSLAEDASAVSVDVSERQGKVVLSLSVGANDMGRIIGRRGRTAQAIRALVGAEPIIELASIHILERAPRWRVRELDIVSHLEGIDSRAGG